LFQAIDRPPKPVSVSTGIQVQLHNPTFLGIEALQFDEELLHYFTGLETYEKFSAVFLSLGPAVSYLRYYRSESVVCMSPMNQFLLMLAKLRTDLDFLLLSRMFKVAMSTAENIYITWINFCSRQWAELDLWVPPEVVKYFAPTDFKNKFPSTRVLLDATEIPVEKPSNPVAQKATFSSYKNRNTVKVIVGSTPGGLVSYMSEAYGGAASDRQIVERSGLPNKCSKGDSLMADKGFNVQDLFAPNDVYVNIPAFFSKKNRLSEQQVLSDRKVSSKRVHIERIIGMGKTYKILQHPFSATETSLAEHIIRICYMLCNFRNCIVSKDA
jgi:hypothetical protein